MWWYQAWQQEDTLSPGSGEERDCCLLSRRNFFDHKALCRLSGSSIGFLGGRTPHIANHWYKGYKKRFLTSKSKNELIKKTTFFTFTFNLSLICLKIAYYYIIYHLKKKKGNRLIIIELKGRLLKSQSGQNLSPRRDFDSVVKLLKLSSVSWFLSHLPIPLLDL